MAAPEETHSDQAREALSFLAGSWNRLEVLGAIAESPRTRAELRDLVDVSRVTLSRILADLEDRGWVTRETDGYRTTRSGTVVAGEIGGTLANLRTLERLGENVSWIRLEEFDFPLARLADAEIITPTWDDFSAQTSMLVDLVYRCERIRGLGTGMDREFMRAIGDATLNGDLSVEIVFKPAVVEAINAEPELSRLFRDLADADDTAIYRYNGQTPLMELGINETKGDASNPVMLCGEHAEGAPPGTVKTTDPVVRDWAVDFFTARRSEAHRLNAPVFTV